VEVRELLDYIVVLIALGIIVIGAAALVYYKDAHGHHR
jgi:hypothetical protein